MRIRDLVRDRAAWMLAILPFVYFWRPLTTETFFFRDLYQLFVPNRFQFIERIASGEFPLWDALTNGGQPFLASPQSMALHPIGLLYLFLPTIAAFNVSIVLHVSAAAVGAYWLARVCGFGTIASVVAAIGFALCGVTLSSINLMPTFFGLPWIPITIGLTHRAIRDRRSLVPAAVAAAIPLFSAAAELTAMLFATLVVWILFTRDIDAPRRVRTQAVALVMLAAVGLSLVQIAPATSVIEQSIRKFSRTYEQFTSWSVAPERLPELVVPRFFGDSGTMVEARYWGRSHETLGYPYVISIYFGIPLLLLAAAGATSADPRLPVRALGIFAAAAVLLALGKHLPGFRLFYELPGVATFRYPVKALVAALLPIALLAGVGSESLLAMPKARRRVGIGALALAIACVLAMITVRSNDAAPWFAAAFRFVLEDEDRRLLGRSFLHAAIAAAAVVSTVACMQRRPQAAQVVLAVIVAADLSTAGWHVNLFGPRSMFDDHALAQRIRAILADGRFHAAPRKLRVNAPDPSLVWLARWQLATLDGYTGRNFGLPVVYHIDYDKLAPKRMADMTLAYWRVPWASRLPLLHRANVRVFMAPEDVAAPGVRLLGTMTGGPQPLHVYLNGNAMPARFVSRVAHAPTEREALRRVVLGSDLDEVVLEGSVSGPLAGCGSAAVRLETSRPERARYRVNAPCDGYVVFAQNHYDGWRVTVDGKEVEARVADYAFTAVPVSGGPHTIIREYHPPRLAAGALGSLLTLILLLVADRAFRRRGATGE